MVDWGFLDDDVSLQPTDAWRELIWNTDWLRPPENADMDIPQRLEARARAIAMKIENTAASQSWKLGTFRLDIQPDGRR